MTESEIVHECWECNGCTTLLEHIEGCRSHNDYPPSDEIDLHIKLTSKEHEKTTI